MNEIENYMYLYKILDVLTTLAIDQDFTKKMSAKFNLKPLNFVALALYSRECTLKITKIEFELLKMLAWYLITEMILGEE